MMNYEQFKSEYNICLNNQQEKAVQAIEGPVLLLAVPGSGKTTVLVNRLGYMIIGKGINPSNILTMTYTVSATKDMASRCADVFGEEFADELEFRTINGVCDKIISYYSWKYNRVPFELESSESELTKIIINIYKQMTLESDGEYKYLTESERKEIKTAISYVKNMMLSDDEISSIKIGNFNFYKLYKEYCKVLKENRLMDYDDQLVIAHSILKKYPDILEYYQNKYKYICVDEAQDTSKIQHEIIKLLSRKSNNIFMVGDEDQSIYAFRAAYPQALMNFEKNYNGASVLLMETNYRSSKSIVDTANNFIAKNENRHEKTMVANNNIANAVKLIEVPTVVAQYQKILNALATCNEQTAVLFRNNETAIALICMLDVLDCDTYYFKGADVSFFTDRLVTDIINILKFSSNPYDTELFKEICYKTIFKIKKEAVANICEICERYSIDVFDAINRCQYITDNHKKFFFARKSDFLKLSHIKVSDAIDKILYEFDYYKYIKGRKDVNAQKTINSKITTLKVIGRYDKNFYLFLKRFEHLKSIIKSGFKSANSSIILSTIHSSKGLEYNNVHIADVVDGTLPSLTKGKNMSKSDKECYLEERRLFYVAMTRAKNKLFVYSIDEQKSEFISEVRDFLNTDEAENPQTPKTSFKIGDKVKHKTFGTGIVLEIKDNRFVRIIFDNVKHGTKTIDKSYITKNQ